MSSFVGEMPSNVGEVTSAPVLQYVKPRTPEEEWRIQNERKSQWETEQEKRSQRRARLQKELAEAEAKAIKASAQLTVAESKKKDLLSAKERTSERWLRDPLGYARAIRLAADHLRNLAADLRTPEKIKNQLARLDAELQPDELALVAGWNGASVEARRFLLKSIGLVDLANEIFLNQVPTTRG